MSIARGLVSTLLITTLFACGGSEEATAPSGAATQEDPLIGLTDARLDEFLAICRAAEVDPHKDATQIAAGRGWDPMRWLALRGRIRSISRNGGYDGMIAHARDSLAEYEAALEAAGEGEAPAAVALSRPSAEQWRRTLAQEEAMRPGGELVEARILELEEFLPE